MLTAPITTDSFQTKVLDILSNYLGAVEEAETPLHSIAGQASVPAAPILPSLSPSDTSLGPNDIIGQLIVTTSTWIDLTSPDPLIADISRQILVLEIAYASFCGATNVMIKGPPAHVKSEDGLIRYAHAIQEALGAATYLQLHLTLPMTGQSTSELEPDMGDLETFARDEYVDDLGIDDEDEEEEEEEADEIDGMASWDAWNVVRSLCRYNARLSIGKNTNYPFSDGSFKSHFRDVLDLTEVLYFANRLKQHLLFPKTCLHLPSSPGGSPSLSGYSAFLVNHSPVPTKR
jgi:protein arginine N-methyltransferase 5